MIEQLITDQPAWKLRLKVNNCLHPENLKHITLTGEQYNDDGELTTSSTYDFFLTAEEVSNLSTTLSNGIK